MTSPHTTLKEVSEAYHELMSLRRQVGNLAAKLNDEQLKTMDLAKENAHLHSELERARLSAELSEGDEDLLFGGQVVLEFTRPFTGGRKLIGKASGREVCKLKDKAEGPLLAEAIRRIRAKLRTRG